VMHDAFALAVLGLVLGVILMEIVYANEEARLSPRGNSGEDFAAVSENDRTPAAKRRPSRRRKARGILAMLSHISHHHTIPGKHA